MENISYATETESSYENFIAICPHCKHKNIFNRITDLKDINPIAFKKVYCLSDVCGRLFNINGDSASPAYKMLIWDCYALKKEKRYSYCMLNLAQSFEVFFSLYLRIKLLYKPFADQRQKLEELNQIALLLVRAIKDYPYVKMRNIFIRIVLSNNSVKNLHESRKIINNLNNLASDPSDTLINSERDHELRSLLLKLKTSEVPKLRNKVVHKHAYRPSLDEVETAIEENKGIIFGLVSCLGAWYDDINLVYQMNV